ncbi:MAG TPA: hypothetical protein VK633_01665, partial [Verrucomicrobiae bacterium]|nr:hypothetical protein [Verrucomicrobiae bacterium]
MKQTSLQKIIQFSQRGFHKASAAHVSALFCAIMSAAAATTPLDDAIDAPLTSATTGAQSEAISSLQRRTGQPLKVRFWEKTGAPMLIEGQRLEQRPQGISAFGIQDIEEVTARRFLRRNSALLRIEDTDAELVLDQADQDPAGSHHLRFVQQYKNIKIWPGELLVHIDAQGNVQVANGTQIATPSELSTEPALSAAEAVAKIPASAGHLDGEKASTPELIIYGPVDASARLAWRFVLATTDYVVDAQTADVLFQSSLNHQAYANGAYTATGLDTAGQRRPLSVWYYNSGFYLFDTSKPMFSTASGYLNGIIDIRDARGSQSLDHANLNWVGSANGATWDAEAVGAAYGLSKTYDYYYRFLGLNSLDGKGGSIRAIVNSSIFGNSPNAAWYTTYGVIAFGKGASKAIDFCAHELTHGVVDYARP